MKKGFNISNLISFTYSNDHHHHQSVHQFRHHINSPLLSRFFSSSSYNNRSNDVYAGGRQPPPRRRSGDNFTTSDREPPRRRSGDNFTTSDRAPSSSRLSGFIDGDDDRSTGDNRGQRRRRDSDTNRNPKLDRDSTYRQINRASSDINRNDNRKSDGNSSNFAFDDDEQKPQFSRNRRVEDDKSLDADVFLDRFKLGFNQDKSKLNFENSDSGPGEVVAEEPPPTPPEDADEIFRKMKETGLIPNAVAMLHGLCSDGLVQDAMKLFGVMRERGSIPEVVIYTAVVEGFCKSNNPDEAIRIFMKMKKNGIVPNAYSYGVLVQGLVKGKRLDDGFDFCLEMVEAGHSPNLVTFTSLVNGFCRERGLEAAQVMISKLKDKGFGFDERSVKDFMEKKGPFMPLVWEAIFGKKGSQMF